MRKFVLSAFAVALTTALALAGEVNFVSYNKEEKKLTVKEGGSEKTYKLSDKTAIKTGDKDVKDKAKAMERFEKMKAGAKFELTADKDEVTEIKFPAPKKDK